MMENDTETVTGICKSQAVTKLTVFEAIIIELIHCVRDIVINYIDKKCQKITT